MLFPSNNSCIRLERFISDTMMQRSRNDPLSIWGRVGSVDSPHLVMPRMCCDGRFLNLWIKYLPVKVDYISHLLGYKVRKFHFQTTLDDKSEYDHIALSDRGSGLHPFWRGVTGMVFRFPYSPIRPEGWRLFVPHNWPRCYKFY